MSGETFILIIMGHREVTIFFINCTVTHSPMNLRHLICWRCLSPSSFFSLSAPHCYAERRETRKNWHNMKHNVIQHQMKVKMKKMEFKVPW